MRRALVNDIVRAFTFRIRTGERQAFFPITDNDADRKAGGFHSAELAHFSSWGFANCSTNYPFVFSCLTLLAGDLRSLDSEERKYAVEVFERHYAHPQQTRSNLRYY
jgi:hypothetical protein